MASLNESKPKTSRPTAAEPAWIEDRRPHRGRCNKPIGHGTPAIVGNRRWREVIAGPRGFEFGPFEQGPRSEETFWAYKLRSPDSSLVPIEITIKSDLSGPQHYVGVVVNPEDWLDRIPLSDGRTARALAEQIRFRTFALPVEAEHAADAWRHVRVSVFLGHRFMFSFRLEEGIGEHVLEL